MSNHRVVTPPGMKHVGWFCEHDNGVWNREKMRTERERPHYDAKWKPDGTVKRKKNHSLISAISTIRQADYIDGRPACPDAIPVFAVDDAYIPPRVWSMSEVGQIPHDVTVKDRDGYEWAWRKGMYSEGWHVNGQMTAHSASPNPHCAPFTELIGNHS